MSVYIKGMDIPTDCKHCPFLDYVAGTCLASLKIGKPYHVIHICFPEERHLRCPLAPLTDLEGRL